MQQKWQHFLLLQEWVRMGRNTRRLTSARGSSSPSPVPPTRPSRWPVVATEKRSRFCFSSSEISYFHCRLSEQTSAVFRLRSATGMAPLIWASIACRHLAIASWRESEFSLPYCHQIAIFSLPYCHHIYPYCHNPVMGGATLPVIGSGRNSWVLSVASQCASVASV